MEVKTITLLNSLVKNYPNDADLGAELRRRMNEFDFSMENDKKTKKV
jgi:hypothetical protein